MDTENITYRKKNKSRSLENINSLQNMYDSEEMLSFSDKSDDSLKSLPNLNVESELIQNLKLDIENLRVQLLSAHTEVENLNLENIKLKREVEKYKNKISLFDKLSFTNTHTPKNSSETIRSRTSLKKYTKRVSIKTLSESKCNKTLSYGDEDNIKNNNNNTTSTQILTSERKNIPEGHSNKGDDETGKKGINSKITQQNNYPNTNRRAKIFIFGDQQIIGLSTKIIKSREGHWNDNYSVVSFVKPYALSNESLKISNTIYEIKEHDIVILAAGANDRNPFALLTELGYALKILDHVKTYVLQVSRNDYLNTTLLNNHISSLVTKWLHHTQGQKIGVALVY
ncbi:unnamed protein product [Colias eurytheme]|nr:unnamed protein product [Colias eurytheme]